MKTMTDHNRIAPKILYNYMSPHIYPWFIQNDKQVFVIDLYICVRLQIADPNNHHVSPRIDSWENDSLNHWILR